MMNLEALKLLAGGLNPKQVWSFSLMETGVRRGALTEMIGPGKTECVLQFLREQPELKVAWIEDKLSVNPCGFPQRHVNLDRVLFVESKGEIFWSALTILKSQIFKVVVLTGPRFSEKQLRMLQLASEKSDSAVLMLSKQFHKGWPVSARVEVSRAGSFLYTQTRKG